jgi:hypothetical protein
MAIVRIIAGATTLSIAAALSGMLGASVVACGGSGDQSLFNGGTPDSGLPAPGYDAGTFNTGNQGDDAGEAPACIPITSGTFTPSWKKPTPFAQAACTAAQIDGFYSACLSPPVDKSTCESFVKANGACSTCIQSQEVDATQGPVIWHSQNAYYTMNIAGCIANEQKDLSANGCGASYQALLECRESACTACFSNGGGSFQNFIQCEQQAAEPCAPFSTAMHNACGDSIHDAGSPASACVPPASTSALDVYKRIAPLFCGQ